MSLASFSSHTSDILARAGHHDQNGTPYNYIPTRYVTIIFLALYSISTALHGIQSARYRIPWLLPTIFLAGLIEVLGWSGRLWSTYNPTLSIPFQIQICCTIIAPTPLVAANFLILSRIVRRLGTNYSRLSPHWYAIIFCSFDFVSLVVQGVGGGLAAVAAGTGKNPAIGGNIMLGGIAFQLVTIVIYVICASEFFTRYIKDQPIRKSLDKEGKIPRGLLDRNLEYMLCALVFNTTCLFIRAVYRVIELGGGWNGRVISTERYFNICDGAMVVLAIYTLNIAHPGRLLGVESPKQFDIEDSSEVDVEDAK